MRTLVRDAVAVNMNTIRVWGGERSACGQSSTAEAEAHLPQPTENQFAGECMQHVCSMLQHHCGWMLQIANLCVLALASLYAAAYSCRLLLVPLCIPRSQFQGLAVPFSKDLIEDRN